MTRDEFERLAMKRGHHVSQIVFESVESYYMSDNDYHWYHGGIEETKTEFVRRVFGGKCNTARSVVSKLADESIRENRWVLRGNASATPDKLDKMDRTIRYHYTCLLSSGTAISNASR